MKTLTNFKKPISYFIIINLQICLKTNFFTDDNEYEVEFDSSIYLLKNFCRTMDDFQ